MTAEKVAVAPLKTDRLAGWLTKVNGVPLIIVPLTSLELALMAALFVATTL